jgi:hypothetical protein
VVSAAEVAEAGVSRGGGRGGPSTLSEFTCWPPCPSEPVLFFPPSLLQEPSGLFLFWEPKGPQRPRERVDNDLGTSPTRNVPLCPYRFQIQPVPPPGLKTTSPPHLRAGMLTFRRGKGSPTHSPSIISAPVAMQILNLDTKSKLRCQNLNDPEGDSSQQCKA